MADAEFPSYEIANRGERSQAETATARVAVSRWEEVCGEQADRTELQVNLAVSYSALARAIKAEGRSVEAVPWWKKAEEQLSTFLDADGADVRARE